LGRALADRLRFPHHDTDDFYWYRTWPPFTQKRPVEERLAQMEAALTVTDDWVLSGSLDGWGDPLIGYFDAVIFLYADSAVRMQRIREREVKRYGEAVMPGGVMHQSSQEFIAWASGYDSGHLSGRSRKRHEAWLARLPCPVFRLENAQDLDTLIEDAFRAVQHLQPSLR
jgi:adenylate kinase family enzyme